MKKKKKKKKREREWVNKKIQKGKEKRKKVRDGQKERESKNGTGLKPVSSNAQQNLILSGRYGVVG